jgi:insulysin
MAPSDQQQPPRFRSVVHSDNIRYRVYDGEILQSPNDVYKCAYLVLENGLAVMLASDPAAEKAAAALCVPVGGLSEPHEIPGLAHFCEHMLFMVWTHGSMRWVALLTMGGVFVV